MIHYADDSVTLHHGDCLDVLRGMPDASVDAVVTDPPYGLEFMGREWDAPWKGQGVVDAEAWNQGESNPYSRSRIRSGRAASYGTDGALTGHAFQAWCQRWATECLRVLKPGGHMLAFGGTRTWHRLACAIEDAGFEVRDNVADLTGYDAAGLIWQHGQGFPKSRNISADLDPVRCQCQVGESDHGDVDLRGVRDGLPDTRGMAEAGEGTDLFQAVQRGTTRAAVGDARAQRTGGLDGTVEPILYREDEWIAQPSVEGRGHVQAAEGELRRAEVRAVSARVDHDGTQGRVRDGASVDHGAVGGPSLDADGVRQPHRPEPAEQRADELGAVPDERGSQAWGGWSVCARCGKPMVPNGLGTAAKPAFEPIVVARKPTTGTVAANVLRWGTGALNVDGCRVETSDQLNGSGSKPLSYGGAHHRPYYDREPRPAVQHDAGRWPPNVILGPDAAAELDRQSQGGASRFFPIFRYEPKAPTSERPRDGLTAHPTVKPLDLMRWLVRLVTPPGGLVLDPFAGSGTTGEAAILEGSRAVLIEREADYLPLIVQRLSKPMQVGLFGDVS